jgi:hypothetical protein
MLVVLYDVLLSVHSILFRPHNVIVALPSLKLPISIAKPFILRVTHSISDKIY